MPNPFDLLGVAETADDDTIKKAYLQQVREHPPERDPDRFQAIRAAFETVKSRRDRLRYRLLHQEPPDLAALVATALQPRGSRHRLSEAQLRQLLSCRLTGQK
jgi:curved DNA-binding protein CbpA